MAGLNHLRLVLASGLMGEDMKEEGKSINKRWYKITLITLKVIPVLLALCALLNTILSFYCLPCDILSMIGGISLLPLTFLYLASYVFRYCVYHRMFLHYLLVTDILNIIDFYIGIPMNNRAMFGLYLVITGVFLFLVLYYYRKEKCCKQ